MGGATRFVTLLTTPFPPLRPPLLLLRRRLSTLSAFPLRPLNLSSSSRINSRTSQLVNSFHSQPNNHTYTLHSSSTASAQQQQHPWPEWTHFLNILSNGQGLSSPWDLKILPEDAFVVYEELPNDFVRAAASCLAFARARPNLLGLLSRREIEAVVSNGTPFLFKSALDAARRMRAFLETDGTNVSELDKATTVDLMKYILSYASNPTVSSERSGLYSRELVDSSVRNLLHELVSVSFGAPAGSMTASEQQFSGRTGQPPRPLGQNVEMKRGDWICAKCNFMNFARNMKCLECEGPRPKRQLTGGEWECPQCNFFNYGRNTVCLRCDCRRPGAPLFSTMDSGPVSFNGEYTNKTNISSSNEEKAQLWFSKISQMNNATDMSNTASDKPLERRLLNPHRQINLSDNGNETFSLEAGNQMPESRSLPEDSTSQVEVPNKENEEAEKSERWFKRVAELHDVKDLPSAVSDEDFPEIMPMRKGENRFVVSKKKDRSLTSPKYKRQVAMDQANNTNFVPFVPFPPGYFARKDTEQPDPPVKAMNETERTNGSRYGNSNATPLPRNADKPTSTMNSNFSVNDTSTGPRISERMNNSRYGNSNTASLPRNGDKPTSTTNSNFSMNDTSTGPRISESMNNSRYGNSNTAPLPTNDEKPTSTTNSNFSMNDMSTDPRIYNPNSQSSGNSGKENASQAISGNENVRSGWNGKSLEGSAVKESDPLDMSEEAKAERWFKRVAQIKDISELSQIPDEDFPSIMPMRKGVNRFVVSKRKTPLERRLTSQQYRRNLPIVSSDSVKKENDSSSIGKELDQ